MFGFYGLLILNEYVRIVRDTWYGVVKNEDNL